MIKIGSYKLETDVLAAPMSGYTDISFRLIAREHGAEFCFFEMMDANSLTHSKRRKTPAILKTTRSDKPIAGQIVGADPSIMVDAAHRMLEYVNLSFLDINAACPVKKVVRNKAGAYLLHDRKKLYTIIRKMSEALDIPVTVKIRIGYEEKLKDNASLVQECESNGAKTIFVHGRTRSQGYTGNVDYDAIREIKNSAHVPVFGSGDVFTPELAQKMFAETGCDGILVARGSLGNPWIFRQIAVYRTTGKIPPPISIAERKTTLKKHLAYIEEHRESNSSGKVGFMRKIALWYLKGFPEARRLRGKVILVKSYDKMLELVDEINDTGE